jgi:Flp pilus assembly protein TadD
VRRRWRAGLRAGVSAALIVAIAGCAGTGPRSGSGEAAAGELARRMEIARTVLTGGSPREAAKLYADILEDHPGTARAQLGRARALLAAGATYEAIAAFEALHDDDAFRTAAQTGLGRAYLQLRRPAIALRHLNAALSARPDAVDALNAKGVALAMEGRLEAARSAFSRAVQERSGFVDARSNKALTYALAGDTGRALEILKTLAGRSDAPPRIRQNLALVYGLAGERAQAQRLLLETFDTDAVRSNLQFYAMLRGLDSPRARARALFGQSAPDAPASAGLSRADRREIERLLARFDFAPGPVDGRIDGRSRAAIRKFQKIAGLDATGQPSPALLTELREVGKELGVVSESDDAADS